MKNIIKSSDYLWIQLFMEITHYFSMTGEILLGSASVKNISFYTLSTLYFTVDFTHVPSTYCSNNIIHNYTQLTLILS